MQYYSLNKQSVLAGFREAVVNGQAPDGGLYFPREIPKHGKDFFSTMRTKSKEQLAFEVMRPFVGPDLAEEELFNICAAAIDFEFPLVYVSEGIFSLELFHGPTLAFKDVGAKFLAGCLSRFARKQSWKNTVLVATSGDTGSAVANAFLNAEGIEVVVLYPSGKVSRIQEQQLSSLGGNVKALEVDGTFDDCQRMVKQAFADKELQQHLHLTSANSINVARWLSQQFYYYFALQQWPHEEAPVISVPSGNFGNICAGLLAQAGGLPVKHFIAACNANDAFTDYVHTAEFIPRQAVQTISNAMDVGDPSNFKRVMRLFDNDHSALRNMVSGFSIDDRLIIKAMQQAYKQHHYMLDPHGAVAYYQLQKHIEQHPGAKGIFLETAHPVKFEDVVHKAIGERPEVPARLREILKQPKQRMPMSADFEELKEFLFYDKALVQPA